MADLYNLLDGLHEEEEAHRQEETNQQEQEWDNQDREELDLPPALEEAGRHKFQAEEEPLEDDDEEAATQRAVLEALAYTRLKKMWSQEMHSPELLPFVQETFDRVTQALQEQEEQIETFTMEDVTGNANMDALFSSLLAIDVERTKFLLCDVLKQRLHKIEAHPLHMRENIDCMSDNEVAYLKEYGAMVERHLRRTVLDHFPQDVWKKLDEPEMIDEPDLDTYVFIRTKEDVALGDIYKAGTSLIVQYSEIRNLFLQGKVELLE